MWIFSLFGFFSVVQERDKPDTMVVRARIQGDLDALREKYIPELTETVQLAHRDYPYRAYCTREVLAKGMVGIVTDLTYGNFKSEVARVQGWDRETLYSRVWSVMLDGERKLEEMAKPKHASYEWERTMASLSRKHGLRSGYLSALPEHRPLSSAELDAMLPPLTEPLFRSHELVSAPVVAPAPTPALLPVVLTGQAKRVADAMEDGEWRTLEEIEARTGDGEASISARLRCLRKVGYQVERRLRANTAGFTVHEYRVTPRA